MLTAQGNLVIIGINTDTPQVLFNGIPVTGIVDVKVDWEEDERRVRMRVDGNNLALYRQLGDAGVTIKRVSK